ncbi:collagen alpha-1(I) chain-like [Bos mutus]|uniref:collagen alpha-1(I) chain-like n=1 Tax=Bos mutus TaxID=72004 RepID=UPI0038B6385F
MEKSPAPPRRTGVLRGAGPAPKSGQKGTPGPPPRKPHGAHSVPGPKGARSRKSRPHADVTLAADAGRGRRPLKGGDERHEAGVAAENRGNARLGRHPERPLGVAKIPRGERKAQSGPALASGSQSEARSRAGSRAPRLIPTQLLRGFPPASRLCARPRSSHPFFLSEDSGGGPGATAACLRAQPC